MRILSTLMAATVLACQLAACVPAADAETLRDRQDLIYGSEIGAWDTNGGTAIHNQVARDNVRAARIKVVRWGVLDREAVLKPEFGATLDGIANLGAVPMIKLPPMTEGQCLGDERQWSISWLKDIVRAAGPRVLIYEFGNEPDHYCGWKAAEYTAHWLRVAPQLKRFARSQGFEILLGGPGLADSHTADLAYMATFLKTTRSLYQATGDRDYVPDFVSSHTYLTDTENASIEATRARIDAWGGYFDSLRALIDTTYRGVTDRSGRPLGPQIKMASTEWNFTVDNQSTRGEDVAFTSFYVPAMFQMMREHGVWLSCQFTIASHHGGALDLLREDGTGKPLYEAYKAASTVDPQNPA
ncbi:hypothetical protein [Longispora albida]|uniref:hypothetical protein n=1 Tax=Longispora albida TaxID=203523 RepID=UPI000382568E|nr:hypothetical protein [Longispora albida]